MLGRAVGGFKLLQEYLNHVIVCGKLLGNKVKALSNVGNQSQVSAPPSAASISKMTNQPCSPLPHSRWIDTQTHTIINRHSNLLTHHCPGHSICSFMALINVALRLFSPPHYCTCSSAIDIVPSAFPLF